MKIFNSNQSPPPLSDEKATISLNYQITHDALPHESIKKLPPDVQEYVQKLYSLTRTNPKQAIAPLLELIEKYPNVPVFYNYLRVAYEARGKKEKVDAVLTEVYQKHPDYLFAKTNYAFKCLRNGEPEEIPNIFDHKFDLKLLYPQRDIFHISEFSAFTGVMALYYLMIDDTQSAEKYYRQLRQWAPTHHLTEIIKYQLYPSPLPKLLDSLGMKIDKTIEFLANRFGNKTKIVPKTKVAKSTKPSDYSKHF
jgi:tetratricopeptide (TPR) repeat protein